MSWIAIVLNANAGNRDRREVPGRLTEIFSAAGRETRITVVSGGAEARSAVEQAVMDGCETLIAGGGDGTVNMAASVLQGGEIPLGILPLGTLNHFAKDLKIPLELEDAVRVVLNGTLCRVDVGEVNGRIFLNNSSLGVYPAIVGLRERYQATGVGKWLAALWASMAVLRRHPFMTVRILVEDRAVERRTPFVLVGNNEYRMVGFQAGSRDLLDQGQLAVYVLNAERRMGLLRLGWQVLRKGATRVKELDLLTVTQATIETRRLRPHLALDGEVVPLESPLEFRVLPKSLWVHVPDNATACGPVPTGQSSSR